MKKYSILFVAMLLGFSCSSQKEVQKSAEELNSVPVRAESSREEAMEAPIIEREEKLVEVEEEPPAESRYYVIIGSFRNRDNAIQYQKDISDEGFTSVLLRNEAGLYRVSVMATEEVTEARDEIRRIRMNYPQHEDTWLLIRME